MKSEKNTRSDNTLIVIALAVVLLLAGIRFNRDQFLSYSFADQMGDAADYILYVDYFKGSAEAPNAPFVNRPLVPWLAHFVPSVSSQTALNLINLLLVFLGNMLMVLVIKKVSRDDFINRFGLVLLVCSFPLVYYSTIGYVDSILILEVACLIFWMIHYQGRFVIWPALVISLGVFGKESSLVLLPILTLIIWQSSGTLWKPIWQFVGLVSLVLVCLVLTRIMFSSGTQYVWEPSIDLFIQNITRPNTWIAGALSFGISGCLLFYLTVKSYQAKTILTFCQQNKVWLFGQLVFVGLFFISLFTAHSDGRFLWPGNFFAIPLVCLNAHQFGFTRSSKIEFHH